ncbi:MAG: N-acetylglucosamine-6-phosphate deacetylase [Brevinema sp.]
MNALQSPRIFTGTQILNNGVIIWDNGIVLDIGDTSLLEKYPSIKLQQTNLTVIPGFVDIQVNGAGGADFYGEGLHIDTLKQMATTLRSFGCTSFCPTLITSTDDDIKKALALSLSDDFPKLGCLGLHIEGPMFSFEHKGAHNPDLLRVLSPEIIDQIIHQSRTAIVSLSPEVAPMDYIYRLSSHGIKVSVAHTNGTLADVRSAERYGATLGTHLYNGMSRFSSREPNVVGALLTSDKISSSIIPDGNHSDFESVKLAHRLLGDKLISITDGIVAMGTSLKKFKLGFQWVHIDEKNQCVGDYGGLAGSMITPIECIQNLVNHCDFTLKEAIESYTYAPAKALNKESQVGHLCKGASADFSLLDECSLSLNATYFRGSL